MLQWEECNINSLIEENLIFLPTPSNLITVYFISQSSPLLILQLPPTFLSFFLQACFFFSPRYFFKF